MLAAAADLRPDLSFIMIGPVVKIEPHCLPQRPNIHWLGGRDYSDLQRYLAHWQLGIMPFALNDATRYISPTKTPEFLAARLPVISTPITDVQRPYGDLGLVEIAPDARTLVEHAGRLLTRPRQDWQKRVDSFLSQKSWDRTWAGMHAVLQQSHQQSVVARRPRIEERGDALL